MNHCLLCRSTRAQILSNKDRKGKALRTVICVQCGLVRTDPLPSGEEIREFYSRNYRVEYMRTWRPTLRLVHRAGINALHRWRELRPILRPGQKILDVGAGGGEFVFLLQKLGWDAHGLEPNLGYGSYAAEELGVPIEIGFAETTEIPPQSFDVITLYHILEHFRDPAAILCRIREWLRDDGTLVIEVPNVEAVCQAPSHVFHRAHLYNFNPQTLELFCRQCGFSIEKTVLAGDGGTITTRLKKAKAPVEGVGELPGNADRIQEVFRRHTVLRHYMSHYPYLRPIRKMAQYSREFLDARRAGNGRELLEQLYRSAKSIGTPSEG